MATTVEQSAAKQNRPSGRLLILLLVLGGALSVLCYQGYLPHHVMWANDMPLGAMMDPAGRLPGAFAGHWGTLYYIGGAAPSFSPSFSTLLQALFPPDVYLKVYAPLSMLFLGVGAWLFFRQLGFASAVCVIGGVGAGLNMHFFSNACWGLGQWSISSAMVFIAMAVLISPSVRPLWVKASLSGLCVGMVVMEGFDVGAILSLYVGMFVVFYFLTTAPVPFKGIARAIGMETVVIFFALFISGSTIFTLLGTQVQGVSTGGQSEGEKKQRWDFTTQWSFPKLETVRLIIPGVFGYRLKDYTTDTNKAGVYWGSIGEDPHIQELESSNPKIRSASIASIGGSPEIQTIMESDDLAKREQIIDQVKASGMQLRHTGSGDYTGVLVCFLAVFGLFNSWRKVNPIYSNSERQAVWFWGIAALISLMAAWGRHGSLYQFIYHLPFLSNIRNPIKFLHPLNICLIILSGYGLESLHRRYMRNAVGRTGMLPQHVMNWWRKAPGFEKKWAGGTLLVLGASILGLFILTSDKNDLANYLSHNGFSSDQAPPMAAFCIHEVALFVLFFAASIGVVIGILSGAWSGKRAIWAWVFLGAIMIVDLVRADEPWVRYYDVHQKYSMNPVVNYLRDKPWEHRITSRLSPTGPYDIAGDSPYLGALCHWWLENDYLANDIESLEIDQAPRLPDLDRNYINDFGVRSQQDLSPPVRMWRLTNTRYLLADARVTAALNQLAEPKNSFRNVMLMDIVQKPNVDHVEDAGDLTVQTNENGHIALIEFTQALPRTKLYANWQMADDNTTLQKLNSPQFDPAKVVLVANDTPVEQKPTQPEADPGTVTITSYQPRDVKMQADAKTPAVLLLNDRTGDYWKVWVDDKPANLLRCNYIMRGVYLPPGQHTVEFHYHTPMKWFYISLTALCIGILLTGYVVYTRFKGAPESSSTPEKT